MDVCLKAIEVNSGETIGDFLLVRLDGAPDEASSFAHLQARLLGHRRHDEQP
jgi:hypothetical protein